MRRQKRDMDLRAFKKGFIAGVQGLEEERLTLAPMAPCEHHDRRKLGTASVQCMVNVTTDVFDADVIALEDLSHDVQPAPPAHAGMFRRDLKCSEARESSMIQARLDILPTPDSRLESRWRCLKRKFCTSLEQLFLANAISSKCAWGPSGAFLKPCCTTIGQMSMSDTLGAF